MRWIAVLIIMCFTLTTTNADDLDDNYQICESKGHPRLESRGNIWIFDEQWSHCGPIYRAWIARNQPVAPQAPIPLAQRPAETSDLKKTRDFAHSLDPTGAR